MGLKAFQVILILFALVLSIGLISIEVSHFLNTKEYVEADILHVEGTTIILGSGCTAIIAQTSPERAESIRLGLAGRINERPNTHDLFVEAFNTFNITIDSVTLDRFDGRYYYSSIFLAAEDKVLKIDSKPSDAIAIALRAKAPIYINKTLLSEVGENVC